MAFQLPNNPKLPAGKRDTDQDMDSDASDPPYKKKAPKNLQDAAKAKLAGGGPKKGVNPFAAAAAAKMGK